MITGELKTQIDGIWNTFWTGGISNTITIVEQLTYLIFIKDLDETETRNERKALRGFKYTPLFAVYKGEKDEVNQQNFRWKNLKEMDVNARHNIFSNTVDGVFPFIRSLGKDQSLFSTYMKGATFGISKPSVLDQVMEKLERIDMTNQDTKGDIYEYLLSKLEGGGTAGQFRTPRHIIKLMVELMQPSLEDTICDPSAGTAGFLVAAKEYIDKHNEMTELDKKSEHINKTMFNGTEFDATMLRIASMNLYLHGIEEPNIVDVDAVSKDNTVSNAYTLMLANPPFKGTIDKESISAGLKNVTDTSKTELLFLALMLRQLKKGGRAAVIVPDGVLFNNSNAHKSIRKEIIENNKLEAVISMPNGVFNPYTPVSTAIIIFTKTGSGGTDNVWFYDMLADGKSLDVKRNLLVDEDLFMDFAFGNSLENADEELKRSVHNKFNLPQILDHYRYYKSDYFKKMHGKNGELLQVNDVPENLAFNHFMGETLTHDYSDRTSQSFIVPFNEIKENDWDLSINRYKEIFYEEVKYDEPKVILQRINEMDEKRVELKKLLLSKI
ncbi:type I restriction enzyme M protein [Flavobacterium omnivorum]|uniref:site-specific DNA-methyltransferase (adenine-specific) n=1 Tax=Flavobacterium omnivorum TaxID=178355 RepID=A0A1G8H5F9_9FLAO|nr:class I SAM-dependent DNA methyltransferase [Flavobacterium omnivorum]SDI01781.1 type I restriction enzyme M protein [Flavobacterium omnivorum]